MNYETFSSFHQAREAGAKLKGWPGWRVEEFYAPDSPDSDNDGMVFIIHCTPAAETGYLYADGYVR